MQTSDNLRIDYCPGCGRPGHATETDTDGYHRGCRRKHKARIAREREARIRASQAETRAVVASGACPHCGSALRRNLALTGWWQCAQYGAETHRADATRPACNWQGFTE